MRSWLESESICKLVFIQYDSNLNEKETWIHDMTRIFKGYNLRKRFRFAKLQYIERRQKTHKGKKQKIYKSVEIDKRIGE